MRPGRAGSGRVGSRAHEAGGRMNALFATGRAADLALLVLALEAGVVTWRGRRGRGPAPAEFAGFWGAGAGLLLALRGALRGAWWGWVALPLAGAGVAHLADLRRRAVGERR